MHEQISAQAQFTRKLCDFLCALRFEDLPKPVVHEARRGVLDWLGCAQAGSHHPTLDRLIPLLQEIGGRPEATVFGRQLKLGLLDAPLVNGQMAHVLDYDDTYMIGTVLHASSPILPALFALAERENIDGKQFLLAYIVGFETAVRIARAAADHHSSGWHPTGTLGTIGAGAASARLLGLDAQRLTYAVGIAATQSAGLAQNRGTMCKSFHAGKAASNGLLAALLAARGFDSAQDILGGEEGYCRVYSSDCNAEALVASLGDRWAIEGNGHKPYSCAIGLHPVIDAMISIRSAGSIEPTQIERIELNVHPYLKKYRLLDNPENGLQAKFSAYHAAAVAFTDGAAGMAQFTDRRTLDPSIMTLRQKVHLTFDESLRIDQAHASIVAGGIRHEARVEHATGTVNNPMTDAAIHAKFAANAEPVIGPDRTRQVAELVWHLDSLPSVRDLVALCA